MSEKAFDKTICAIPPSPPEAPDSSDPSQEKPDRVYKNDANTRDRGGKSQTEYRQVERQYVKSLQALVEAQKDLIGAQKVETEALGAETEALGAEIEALQASLLSLWTQHKAHRASFLNMQAEKGGSQTRLAQHFQNGPQATHCRKRKALHLEMEGRWKMLKNEYSRRREELDAQYRWSLACNQREEAMKRREDEIHGREEAATTREDEVYGREEAVTTREAELRKKEQAIEKVETDFSQACEGWNAILASREDCDGHGTEGR